jgi:hypothetical protein
VPIPRVVWSIVLLLLQNQKNKNSKAIYFSYSICSNEVNEKQLLFLFFF